MVSTVAHSRKAVGSIPSSEASVCVWRSARFCSLSSRTTSGSPPSSHTCNDVHVQRHFLKRQLRTVRRYERGCDWLAVNSAFPPPKQPIPALVSCRWVGYLSHCCCLLPWHCCLQPAGGGLHAWFNRGAADMPPPPSPQPHSM